MNIKGNKHWRETDDAIMATVIRMTEQRDIFKVSVTAVCTELGINRSTFYEHFDNVIEVLETAERHYGEELAEAITEGQAISRHAAFLALFSHVRAHAAFYRAHLRRGGHIKALSEAFSPSALMRAFPSYTPEELAYHLEFFRGGVEALALHWIEGGCKETSEDMCLILVREYEARQWANDGSESAI